MNNLELQQEISIIRKMIEKTRQETAESGHLFITLGIVWVLVTAAIGFLEVNAFYHLIWPVLIAALILTVVIGLMIGLHEGKKERVQSYARKIFASVWLAVAVTAILVSFVFPFTHVYDNHLVPVFVSPVLGIGFFLTGIIYESKVILYCSLSWWIGSALMAYLDGYARLYIMIGILIIGYILPGIVLNFRYKKKRHNHED